MGQVKVRHALIQYRVSNDANALTELAFRNQVVNLPSSEERRLREAGAVIDADAEPERPGILAPLPETASDEEVIGWVLSASETEIASTAAAQPLLAHRIAAARDHIRINTRDVEAALRTASHLTAKIREDNPLVVNSQEGAEDAGDPDTSAGGAKGTPGPEEAEGAGVNPDPNVAGAIAGVTSNDPTAGLLNTGEPVPPSSTNPDGTPQNVNPPDPLNTEAANEVELAAAFDRVVTQNVEKVSAFLSEHPETANGVLAAEERLAATGANNGKPRQGVVKAAEAAAGFTQ